MSKKNDLKSYLLHWKENISADVTGQSAAGPHLEEDVLKSMARSIAGIDKASITDVDHLSFCPECLERWGTFFNDGTEPATPSTLPTITYGTAQENDVSGQSADQHSQSQCKNFTLSISIDTADPLISHITLKSANPQLEGRLLQVRDKSGQILLDGPLQNGQLTSATANPQEIELSLWTVIVGDLSTPED